MMKKILFAIMMVCLLCMGMSSNIVYASDNMAYGADVGWLSQLEDHGVTWVDDNGEQKDPILLLKEKGINAIRIRAFVKPNTDFKWTKLDGTTCWLGYNDTKGVLYTAKRAEELGMDVMIVLHYSDHFADPMYQDVPSEWKNATASELEKYVYDYTYYLMTQLANEGVYPKWVQVGNEINGGILHPYGNSTNNFKQLAAYLNSGYNAVKAVSPDSKVVTHLANLGNLDVGASDDFTWFLDNFINTYGGKTDIIGMSYYPYWIGKNDIEGLSQNLYELSQKYNKEVMVVETGGDAGNPQETYDLLRKEINALKSVPGNKGAGIFYWEPEAHASLLPDQYPLGATELVGDKILKYTSALDAFKQLPVFLSPENSFEIRNYESAKALNVAGGNLDNSANIEQYEYSGWDSQKWYFEKAEGDYYKIVNKNSGKVLEIDGMSMLENAACTQCDYNGGQNQMWKIIPTSDGKYKIQNRMSGLYLGIMNGSNDNGAWCVQVAGDSNVKWYLFVTE